MVRLLIRLFCFNDTATTEIYTLSLHDALPIWGWGGARRSRAQPIKKRSASAQPQFRSIKPTTQPSAHHGSDAIDRKSTRLNSSHANISYAVFCLKKKNRTY